MTPPAKAALEPAAGAQPRGHWITTQRQRPMSLAVMLPQLQAAPADPSSQGEDFWALVEKAKLALEIGFDMIWIPDHFMIDLDPDAPPRGLWEAWPTMAGLAAALPVGAAMASRMDPALGPAHSSSMARIRATVVVLPVPFGIWITDIA